MGRTARYPLVHITSILPERRGMPHRRGYYITGREVVQSALRFFLRFRGQFYHLRRRLGIPARTVSASGFLFHREAIHTWCDRPATIIISISSRSGLCKGAIYRYYLSKTRSVFAAIYQYNRFMGLLRVRSLIIGWVTLVDDFGRSGRVGPLLYGKFSR